MRIIKLPPLKPPKEMRPSFGSASEQVEINMLLRESARALEAESMVSGHRMRVAARLLQHLEFRVNEE